MQTYIALLRGINVSGKKLIKMSELRTSMEELSFENVRTYIQSGNVVFTSALSSQIELQKLIEKLILDKFGFDVSVVVLTPEELNAVIKNNPFEGGDLLKIYIAFLAEYPEHANIGKLAKLDFSPDTYVIKDKSIYILYPDGAGKSKLTNNLFESKLKVIATTRNWKTCNELLNMTIKV